MLELVGMLDPETEEIRWHLAGYPRQPSSSDPVGAIRLQLDLQALEPDYGEHARRIAA
jgi:hypothetical protein